MCMNVCTNVYECVCESVSEWNECDMRMYESVCVWYECVRMCVNVCMNQCEYVCMNVCVRGREGG